MTSPANAPIRVVHLAEGAFSLRNSKMTVGVLRYGAQTSVAVVDSTQADKTAQEIVGCGGNVPVLSTLREALSLRPKVLLIGITPPGGRIPSEMRATILEAIAAGLDVWAGMHEFLTDDAEFSAAATKAGVTLWDIRKPGTNLPVGGARCRPLSTYIALMIGSDCAIGKMTTALEIDRVAKARAIKSAFVATGQCGIAIAGWGSPIDAIPGDFMAGCVERDVLAVKDSDLVLVEGQGSLLHPGFSSVTLALLHGSCPDALVLNHQVSRKEISKIPERIEIPDLLAVAQPYIDLARGIKPTHLVAVALNTSGLGDADARAAVADAQRQTGLPASDPVRFGAEPLLEALMEHKRLIGK